jgi:hypothetical protein
VTDEANAARQTFQASRAREDGQTKERLWREVSGFEKRWMLWHEENTKEQQMKFTDLDDAEIFRGRASKTFLR